MLPTGFGKATVWTVSLVVWRAPQGSPWAYEGRKSSAVVDGAGAVSTRSGGPFA
jgi:hypothetical protein